MGRVFAQISRLKWLAIVVLVLGAGPWSAAGQESGQSLRAGQIYAPTFSPSHRNLLAYERQVGDKRKLYLLDLETESIQPISVDRKGEGDEAGGGALQGFMGQQNQQLSQIQGQLAWRPVLDAEGRQWFAFVSSAGDSGYSLYLSYVTSGGQMADRSVLLPFDGQVGLPDWSPNGRHLVFSGSAAGSSQYDLYLYSNVKRFFSGGASGASPQQLTDNPGGDLHPSWSPDGDHIAYQSQQSADGLDNWGVNLLDMASWRRASSSTMPRTVRMSQMLGAYHEYKPTWSPDGQYVAFYVTQSEVGSGSENRQQDIAVLIPQTGAQGRIQGGSLLRGYSGERVVRNVLINEGRGPQWYPSPNRQALVYVRKEGQAGNPIRMANLSQWLNNESDFARTLSDQYDRSTRLHEEASVTRIPKGIRLAFASQVGDNLRLQVRELSLGSESDTKSLRIRRQLSDRTAILRSALFPGLGHFYRGEQTRGWIYAAAGGAALIAAAAGVMQHQNKASEYNDFVNNEYSPEGLATVPPSELDRRTQRLQSLYDDATSARTLRNITVASLAGVWLFNVVDSVWGPEYVSQPVYVGSSVRVQQPRIRVGTLGNQFGPKLSLRVQF